MRRTRKRLFVLTVSLVVSLAVAETGLRVAAHSRNAETLNAAFRSRWRIPSSGEAWLRHIVELSDNPRIVYRLRKDLDGLPFMGAPVSTNSLGFRGPEIPPAGENTRTIVGIGDSLMFGWGVADDAPYLRVLERELRRRRPELSWRVINTGVPGYNTLMEVETLVSRALEFDPDIVVLGLVSNDLGLPNFLRREEDVFTLQKSFLKEFVVDRWYGDHPWHLRRRVDRSYDLADDAWFVAADPDDVPEPYRWMVGWDPFRGALERLADLSRRRGFEVVACSTGTGELDREMIAEAAGSGFHTLDVGESIEGYMAEHDIDEYRGSELVVSATDPHPSPIQHRLIADALFQFLSERGLLDP